MAKFQLGDTIPTFTLPTITGETFSFDQHQQEHKSWHLIVFFRGAWCPVCESELKDFQEHKSFFDEQNVHLLTISTDQQESLQELAEKNDLAFPILQDKDLTALKAFDVYYHSEDSPYEDHGTHGEPAYFLIDENGKLLYQQQQTSPFGRPAVTELRKIVKYIKKNLK
ncbi:redoxin domain-containing protein [Priestia flexa]|uniref:peroxiredoxin family protein n=1 Tax=Priestia flexa TaxID=86664 RepID=UPI000C239D63|nr:redoxin domain-containing protein [Priestia flexa]MEC0668361.1 redoxin domain-containing protein [Priestia flexa]MED3822227.1 redoxin domain-containing protein [Priestia flexa]